MIPAYRCALPYDELNKLREKFWGMNKMLKIASRKGHKRGWLILKGCCETEACMNKSFILATALQILIEAEMACVGDNMRCCVDSQGNTYNIPNFCITDPIFKKEYDVIEKIKDNMIEKIITVRNSYLCI